MKTFKQYRLDEQENSEVNSMLQKYTSGAIENYDNKGSFMNLFDPNGMGVPKLLSNFNLVILDEYNDIFSGKGIVVKDKMTFKLGNDTDMKPIKTLSVEFEKSSDGDYIIQHAKVL